MSLVVVTGGTGHLGRDLVTDLKAAGHRVRILARHPGHDSTVEWAKGDLSTGEGLAEAVAGARTIVNAATYSPMALRGPMPIDFLRTPRDVDLDGTRRLLAEATKAGVQCFVHVSIVGVDKATLPYLRLKLEVEKVVRASASKWSIVRATPFFYLLDRTFGRMTGLPLWLLPTRLSFQPCDSCDFAKYLTECVNDGRPGDRLEFGGPEVLSMGEFSAQYQKARRIERRIVRMPLPGPLARVAGAAFPAASSEAVRGETTWSAWLRRKYPSDPLAG